jgi:hypothetical protein
MASAPWRTIRRVELCITCPGTVKSLSFTFRLPERKTSGSVSKKRVRSSAVSSVIRCPRRLGTIRW